MADPALTRDRRPSIRREPRVRVRRVDDRLLHPNPGIEILSRFDGNLVAEIMSTDGPEYGWIAIGTRADDNWYIDNEIARIDDRGVTTS